MKKLTALALVLCIILSAFFFAACEEKTPAGNDGNPAVGGSNDGGNNDGGNQQEGSVYEIVAAAIEKTLKAKSYEANLDLLLKIDYLGSKSEATSKVNIKAAALDSKPQIMCDSTSSDMNVFLGMDYYYDGEWNYMSMDGEPAYKMESTYDAFAKEIGAPQCIIVALAESLFANAQSQKNSDGSLSVSLALDEATVESLYKDAVTKIVYDIVGEDLNQTVTKDAKIEITVADGYIRDYKLSFVTEITAGSDKVVYKSATAISFVSCDKDVSITPPSNLDEYYEMSWG